MKLLVFAHTPPPHHGQSYMVQLMLEGFGGDQRKLREPAGNAHGIECYHVNARVSRKLEDIGEMRFAKIFLLLWHCLQAVWCRFRYGVRTLYYIPAPGKASALYRDWLVMALCRPFFQRLVLHWHAAGLAKWLETSVQQRTRSTTYRMLQKADLSIVLSTFNRADAEKLFAQRILVVNNGIPDPCPEFDHEVLPLRRRQGAARRALFERLSLPPVPAPGGAEPAGVVRVLYLAHCTREKGLFDACEGVLSANRSLRARGSPAFFKLSVAGMFVRKDEKRAFQSLLKDPQAAREIEYLGFVSGEQKLALLRDSDLFCFPTCYPNENQPVNLIEAMAFGLPILTTRWRSIPELFPRSYPGLVAPNSPGQVAGALIQLAAHETGETFREMFLANFTLERHLASLARALASIETVRPDPTPDVLAAMGARPGDSPAVHGAIP